MTIQFKIMEDMTLLNMKTTELIHLETVVELCKTHQQKADMKGVFKIRLRGVEEIEGGHHRCRVNQSSNSKATIGMLNQIIRQ
jgi:hypothetical protein